MSLSDWRGKALASLLGPTSLARFSAEIWGQRHLLRRAGDGPDLTALLSLDDVDALLGRHALRTPFLRVAKEGRVVPGSAFTGSAGIGAKVADQVDADRVTALLADGSTVVLQGLHRSWPGTAAFVAALTLDLGHPVQANAYLTPAAARGFAAHYDTHDVFVVQLSGSKHWTIHPPCVAAAADLPPWTDVRDAVDDATHGPPAFSGVLARGDVLYLPRGWIHSARADVSTSLHLTLGVHPYTRRHVLDAVVAEALATLEEHVSLPVGVDVSDPAAVAASVEEVRDALVSALVAVTSEDVASSLAARRRRDTRPAPLAPVAQLAAADSQLGEVPKPVVLRDGFPPRLRRTADGVELVAGAAVLAFPSDHQGALRRVLSGASCDARSLPGLEPTVAREVLRRLLLAGVVVPA